MPHHRHRFLIPLIEKTLHFSPLVGILGHRQVGKTTILSDLCKTYYTFDDEDVFKEAEAGPKKFIQSFSKMKKVGIDECQLVEGIFPALKECVRLNKAPGQFLLSGSVRFTSKKTIRESLTGRIINWELLPLTISEIKHQALPQTLFSAFKSLDGCLRKADEDKTSAIKLLGELDHYLERGGLPGICFIRDDKMRKQKIDDQLNTILDRDLRTIVPTTLSLMQIKDFMRALAHQQGRPHQYGPIEKSLKISESTQKKLLYALESVFLIRPLLFEGGRKGLTYLLEDQGEEKSLTLGKRDQLAQLETLLYRHVRAQAAYSEGFDYREFSYLTRGGASIPYVLQSSSGLLGFKMIESSRPSRSDLASANSFLKTYAQSFVLFIHTGKESELINDRIALMSIGHWL